MSKLTKLLFFIFICFLFMQSSFAQNEISSPYSMYGVGVINNRVNGTSTSMGGVAYAMQNPYYINYANPASYIAFDSLSFIADAAFSIISDQLKSADVAQKSSYARFAYLAIGLPVLKSWRTSVGFLPFSDKGYHIINSMTIPNVGDANYSYEGDGGLMQLYWGNAFQLCKGLSIGLNMSYLFGTLTTNRFVELSGNNFYNHLIAENTFLDGIYLTGGIQYFAKIKDDHKLGVGAVYSNTAYIWARKSLLINNYTGEYSSTVTYDTTYSPELQRGNLRVPQSVGLGLSYSYKDKILVAGDVTWQNWEKYKMLGQGDSLKNAWITSVGLQYIPNPASNKFSKQIAFRAGAKFSTGYITLHHTPITEYTVSVGIGLPLKTYNTKCSFNIMLEYGGIGTLKNDLIKQNFLRISLNFILQERWYQRVKLD